MVDWDAGVCNVPNEAVRPGGKHLEVVRQLRIGAYGSTRPVRNVQFGRGNRAALSVSNFSVQLDRVHAVLTAGGWSGRPERRPKGRPAH